MKIHLKILKELNPEQVKELMYILNNDIKLLEHLGNDKPISISYSEFVSHNKDWISKYNAQIFSIIANNEAIGLISLSHINHKDHTAKIGYWITSKYWNRGYTSLAFKQVLNLAREMNITHVSCSISKNNKESKAIWQKFDAVFEEKDNIIVPSIFL
jgi:[ribosomal protein S5]-alanine N-acetyltransferase